MWLGYKNHENYCPILHRKSNMAAGNMDEWLKFCQNLVHLLNQTEMLQDIKFSCDFQQFWWSDTTSNIPQHSRWWDITNNSRWRPTNRKQSVVPSTLIVSMSSSQRTVNTRTFVSMWVVSIHWWILVNPFAYKIQYGGRETGSSYNFVW